MELNITFYDSELLNKEGKHIRRCDKINCTINEVSVLLCITDVKYDVTSQLCNSNCKYHCINMLKSLFSFDFINNKYNDPLDVGEYLKILTFSNGKIHLRRKKFTIVSNSPFPLYYQYPEHKNDLTPLNFMRKLYLALIITEEFPSMDELLLSRHLLTNKYKYTDFDGDIKSLTTNNIKYDHELFISRLNNHIDGMIIDMENFKYTLKVGNKFMPNVIWNIVNSYMETR